MKTELKFFENSFHSIGTEIAFWAEAESGEAEKFKKTFEEIKKFYQEQEKIFSRFDPESELSWLNNNLGIFQKASEDMLYLAKKSLTYHDMSGGFFDPRIIENLENAGYSVDFKKIKLSKDLKTENLKSLDTKLSEDLIIRNGKILFRKRMDFSGIAKGYITDRAVKIIKNRGFKNLILDSGGDLFVSGLSRGEKWLIEIEGFPRDKFALKLEDKAVATSGITRRKWGKGNQRFHHLINPKNPHDFSFEIKSATVVKDSVEKADVWAKILFLWGKNEGLKKAQKNSIPVIYLDYHGNIFISEEAKKYSRN